MYHDSASFPFLTLVTLGLLRWSKVVLVTKSCPTLLWPSGLKNFCFTDYANVDNGVDHTILWEILHEMEIPDHLTCLLRNLYAGQEATVGTGHGTMDWFKIGKGVCQGCLLSPCLFNLYAEYIMRNAGLDEAQARIDCWEKHQQPQICRWYNYNGRKQRRTKEPIFEV